MDLFKVLLVGTYIALASSNSLPKLDCDHLSSIQNKLESELKDILDTYTFLHSKIMWYYTKTNSLLGELNISDNDEEFKWNPIHAFKIIKVLTIDFGEFYDSFINKYNLDVFNQFILLNEYNFPSIKDLRGICEAIARLQDTYNLDENKILNGDFEEYWGISLEGSDLKVFQSCYKDHRTFILETWVNEAVACSDTDDQAEIQDVLREYYFALRGFSQLTKTTTSRLL